MIYIKGEKMKNKFEKYFDVILCLALLVMVFHFKVTSEDSYISIICLCLFGLYFIWYEYFSEKKKIAIIPLWLYLIGYYIINWDTMLDVLDFFKYILFGWAL